MATKNVGNNYPYLLVEQGIKKNQASDRFRIFLAMKIEERADIEMRYIRQMQNWINGLSMRVDRSDPSGRYLHCEVMAKILGSMREEAAQIVDFRQRTYNLMMSELGPYSKLQHLLEEETDVRETEVDFHKLFAKRNNLAKTFKKYIEAREHCSNQIEALENQLMERSHITMSRRPSSRTGPRKIDEMRDRLSRLRRQSDAETEKIASLEEELLDEESSTKHYLTDTEKRLEELETERMRRIIAEIKRYFESLQNTGAQRLKSPRLAIKGQQTRSLEEAEKLLKVHWLDVHTNAKRDEVPDFQDMFATSSAKAKAKQRSKDSDKQPSSEESKLSSHPEISLKESVSTYFYYKSSSGSSVEVDGDGDSVVAEVSRMQCKRAVPNIYPSQKHSEESIETLNLPPEVRCPADISVLDPNKQYTTRMRVGKFRQNDESRQTAHLTEYSSIDKFVPVESESDEENEDAVVNLRNIRVVAIEDNTPSAESSELTFKKGQIIKQKCGANKEGLCYGWTRENLIGKKQYGYYKQHKVKLFKKSGI